MHISENTLLNVSNKDIREGKCIVPDGITKISDYAFKGCTDMISCYIPYTVKRIGSYVFQDCDSLKRLTYGGNSGQLSRALSGSAGNDHLMTSYGWTMECRSDPTQDEEADEVKEKISVHHPVRNVLIILLGCFIWGCIDVKTSLGAIPTMLGWALTVIVIPGAIIKSLNKREIEEIKSKGKPTAEAEEVSDSDIDPLPKPTDTPSSQDNPPPTVSKRNDIPKQLFCRYCGNPVDMDTGLCTQCGKRAFIPPKKRYCTACGGRVDNKTKKCTQCGKQCGISINILTQKQIILFSSAITLLALGLILIVTIISNSDNKSNNKTVYYGYTGSYYYHYNKKCDYLNMNPTSATEKQAIKLGMKKCTHCDSSTSAKSKDTQSVSDISQDLDGSTIVYWVSGGSVYHLYGNCPHLSDSVIVRRGPLADCPSGRRCCITCSGK